MHRSRRISGPSNDRRARTRSRPAIVIRVSSRIGYVSYSFNPLRKQHLSWIRSPRHLTCSRTWGRLTCCLSYRTSKLLARAHLRDSGRSRAHRTRVRCRAPTVHNYLSCPANSGGSREDRRSRRQGLVGLRSHASLPIPRHPAKTCETCSNRSLRPPLRRSAHKQTIVMRWCRHWTLTHCAGACRRSAPELFELASSNCFDLAGNRALDQAWS